MEGLAELKVKESDRLAATAQALPLAASPSRVEGDDLIVEGSGEVKGGARVETLMDHRIAMAFLTLGLGARAPGHGRRCQHDQRRAFPTSCR